MKKRAVGLLLAVILLLGLAAPGYAAQPGNGKVVAMTFDDGPSASVTPQLLDELAKRDVKCTFFVLGSYAALYPNTVARAHAEGHQIASHTYNHKILSQQADSTIRDEVVRTSQLLSEITGETDFMVRLPYGDGAGNRRVLNQVNAPVILWSVDPTNGKYPCSEEQLYQGILRQVHNNAIILLHDTSSANMRAALRAIDTLQSQGWSFVTVEELFRLRGVTPGVNSVYYSVPDPGTAYDETQLTAHWAWESIRYVQNHGIMEGDGVGFKPNASLTRAMAVTILWRSLGAPKTPGPVGGGFADVPADTWYTDAVAWGKSSGVVTGYSDTHFGPTDLVTREQFCTMLVRFAAEAGKRLPTSGSPRDYSDGFRVSSWAMGAVETILDAGFVSRNDISIFRPQDALTRAEAAELLAWYATI